VSDVLLTNELVEHFGRQARRCLRMPLHGVP
jgi:hypothetical protein